MPTLYSWNVNGVRAALKNGLLDWLHETQPDILCLQETRVMPGDLTSQILEPNGYTSLWHPAKKKGYSGTAAYVKERPLKTETFGLGRFDDEGRLQVLEFADFVVLNGYWPNSQPERARLDYKLDFCKALTRLANKLVRDGKDVVICGDLNIAHKPIDLARPKANENNPGYYAEERKAMTRFLSHGYVDTFREFVQEPGHYSWWSYRSGARKRNVGWRLDYHLVNQAMRPRIKNAWISADVHGSDHAPVGLTID